MTLGVITTGSTHHIDERLVVGILHSQVLGIGLPPIILNMYLVGTSKCHTIIVLSKLAGNVQPQQCQFLIILFFILVGRTSL